MPNELPPLGPRPDADAHGLPPLARPDQPTGELPPIPAAPTREFPPSEAPTRVSAPPPLRGDAHTPRSEPRVQPKQPRRPDRATRGNRTIATGAAVILTAALVGAGSARLAVEDDPSAAPRGSQPTAAPIDNPTQLQDAIRSVQSSVVEVRVRSTFSGSQGSGVIIAPQGLIITNDHVVNGASGNVEVVTAAGQSIPAEVVTTDSANDLAVLRPLSSVGPGVTLVPDSSGPPPTGESVFAIGSPFGYQNTVTAGVVSAFRTDRGRPLIQFDAPVNPGNSGGGLFDLNGQLIGIPTSISSPVAGNVGIAFAVPASRVRALLARVN